MFSVKVFINEEVWAIEIVGFFLAHDNCMVTLKKKQRFIYIYWALLSAINKEGIDKLT